MHYTPSTIPPEAADALRRAADTSDAADANEWVQRCKNDTAQLWRDGQFWVVTEIVRTRCGVALHFIAAAGEFSQSLVDEAEEWAKSIGCHKSFFTGRKGWERKLPQYKVRTVTMERAF